MKKPLHLFLLLLAVNLLSAQNLVFNGSFEVYKTCPKYVSQITFAAGWFRPTDGTPDFFNECCGNSPIGIPNNFMGSQKPRTGSGYAGFYLYQTDAPDGYREYISTELKSPLEKGKEYYVKFYVCLGKLSECAIGNIGVLFSNEVNKTGDASRIILKPQLDYTGNIISDTGKWTEMLWTYKAKGNEKFMTIGNFTKAEKCSVKYLVSLAAGVSLKAYYYIDDVCIEEVQNDQPCRCEQDTNTFIPQLGRMKITRDSSVVTKAKAPPVFTIKPEQSTVLENILFETDKSDLLPSSYEQLDQLAEYLHAHMHTRIEFNGYTDNTGIDNKNLILSNERAKAVADYITKKGIDTSRVRYKGLGSANAIGNNLTPEGKAKNRRVEFKIHRLPIKHVDSTYKNQKLKGGYSFVLKRHDSIKYACLIKDGRETEVIDDEADTTTPTSSLGYVYADYDSVFVLATHEEANPIEIQIVDKSTGGATMYGATPFYKDSIKNIIMFEGNHRRAGKLILYDFNTGKSEVFIAPKETPCFCCFCWKVISLTDTEIQIEYLDMKYQKAVQTYSRKPMERR